MEEEKKREEIWYKDWKWWLSKAGWPGFILMCVLYFSNTFINIGGSQKELSILKDSHKELKDSVKEISLSVKRLPLIEAKINQEIIPSINYLKETLKIRSPSIKEMQSLKDELKAKTAQLARLKSYQKTYVESASDIKSVLKKVVETTSGLRSSLVLYTDSLIDIQDKVIKSPDTARKIAQDYTLSEMFNELKGSYDIISKTGSELEKTSETIQGLSNKLEGVIEYKDFGPDTKILSPNKIESPKKEGPAPIPKN